MLETTRNFKEEKIKLHYSKKYDDDDDDDDMMIYLLTAIGLTPGGKSTIHIYTQTIHRTTKLTTRTTQLTTEHHN